jgi:LPXTG-motif cell wall-anchored protein
MNARQLMTAVSIISGGWLILWSIGSIFILSRPAQAQELPPRPTLTPVIVPEEPRSEEPRPTPRLGRIVGTVIDLTTGAPVAGMTVRIDDQELLTDTNGNYGRENLTPGTYVVELIVPPERGTSVQGAIPITLPEGETARQDLAFRSPVRVSSQESSGDAAPVPPPAALPVTGASNGAPWMAGLGVILLTGGVLIARRATR